MDSPVSALIAALKANSQTASHIDNCAHNINICARDADFYKLPFSAFQQVISKTDVISVETIDKILSGAFKEYSILAFSLIPLIDCGQIGAVRALEAIKSLTEVPLLHEIASGVMKTSEPKAQQRKQIDEPSKKQYNAEPSKKQYNAEPTKKQNKAEQPRYQNESDQSPNSFFQACEKGNMEVVQKLLDQKPSLLNALNRYDDQPIHKAVWGCNFGIVELLVELGANVNATDREGMTPLHKSASKRDTKITKFLLDSGANPNIRANSGVTPLFIAAMNGSAENCANLISAGADVNSASKFLDTPLHMAAQHGFADVCMLLISQGANIHAANNRGQKPIDMAKETKVYSLFQKYSE